MGRSLRAASVIVTLATLLLAGAISSMDMEGDRDCGHFGSREEAQAELEATPSDPDRLDGNNDGIACEDHDYSAGTPADEEAASPVATPLGGTLDIDLRRRNLNCADFLSQQAAQAELNANPADPHGLDRNNDGQACEDHDYRAQGKGGAFTRAAARDMDVPPRIPATRGSDSPTLRSRRPTRRESGQLRGWRKRPPNAGRRQLIHDRGTWQGRRIVNEA
ncbi:MAG: hypothetical protein AVDCRST_MAG87-3708 [uncultured Thermomicrobiales bacterium]|uniref:Excalibur calcium-binding domain-containing protein n=1 Tax=uncultured Thermomicrobiales bacterium TaxID=1645740 RepID=A0A6J4VVE1_9BACT|nr:MAG: hypothetical protein AVDCRST_MAG87-3708 [uncultured Thermomicrobiales bacterium]